jgi:hypothetical protein
MFGEKLIGENRMLRDPQIGRGRSAVFALGAQRLEPDVPP